MVNKFLMTFMIILTYGFSYKIPVELRRTNYGYERGPEPKEIFTGKTFSTYVKLTRGNYVVAGKKIKAVLPGNGPSFSPEGSRETNGMTFTNGIFKVTVSAGTEEGEYLLGFFFLHHRSGYIQHTEWFSFRVINRFKFYLLSFVAVCFFLIPLIFFILKGQHKSIVVIKNGKGNEEDQRFSRMKVLGRTIRAFYQRYISYTFPSTLQRFFVMLLWGLSFLYFSDVYGDIQMVQGLWNCRLVIAGMILLNPSLCFSGFFLLISKYFDLLPSNVIISAGIFIIIVNGLAGYDVFRKKFADQ